MQIKSILAGAAIALAATIGAASAADQFATLDGISAMPMNSLELDQVRGTEVILSLEGFGPLPPIDIEQIVLDMTRDNPITVEVPFDGTENGTCLP